MKRDIAIIGGKRYKMTELPGGLESAEKTTKGRLAGQANIRKSKTTTTKTSASTKKQGR